MRESSPRSVLMFFGLFIVIGLIALGVGFYNLARSVLSEKWPVTTGVVTSSKMGTSRSTRHGTTYSANVGYDYEIEGRFYHSTRVSFGDMSASAHYAQGILARYPVGKKVTVYFSPGDPELAVLEPGPHAGLLILFGVGTVFVLAGSMFMQLSRRAAKPAQAPDSQAMSTSGAKQKPPLMMALIFVFMGGFACLMQAVEGSKNAIGYVAGGVFVIMGFLLLSMSLGWDIFQNFFKWLFVVVFMGLFHWIAFVNPGGRGMWPFAFFCVLFDVIAAIAIIRWVVKGPRRLP